MQTHRHALQTGTRLFEYEIIEMIGSGGFGIVYLARDKELEQNIVIKEYLPNEFAVRETDQTVLAKTSKDESEFNWGLEKFLEEARVLATFRDHPNIVSVLRYFRANKTAYMVMEYAGSTSLKDYLDKRKTLTEEQINAIIYPLFDALEVVHQGNLIHRDLKPGNILINNKGEPVLIDFGAARHAIGAKSLSITAIVSAGYSPFEQYTSKTEQGPWTDIYSLSAVLFRCVTGNKPPDATDRMANDDVVLLMDQSLYKKTYSSYLLNFIDRGLGVYIKDRPKSISEWLLLLEKNSRFDEPKKNKETTRRDEALEEGNSSDKLLWGSIAVLIVLLMGYFSLPYITGNASQEIVIIDQKNASESEKVTSNRRNDRNSDANSVSGSRIEKVQESDNGGKFSNSVEVNHDAGQANKSASIQTVSNGAVARSSTSNQARSLDTSAGAVSNVNRNKSKVSNEVEKDSKNKISQEKKSSRSQPIVERKKEATVSNEIKKPPKGENLKKKTSSDSKAIREKKEKITALKISQIEILVKSLSALMGDIKRRMKKEKSYKKQISTYNELIRMTSSKGRKKEYRESRLNLKSRLNSYSLKQEEAKDTYVTHLKDLCTFKGSDIKNKINKMKSENMMFSERFNKIYKQRQHSCSKNFSYKALKKSIFSSF